MVNLAKNLKKLKEIAKGTRGSFQDDADDLPLHSPYQRARFLADHIFIHTHVAKTGGTTLTNGLASIVGWGSTLDRRPRPIRLNPKNLSAQSREVLRLYTGHMLYGEHSFFDQKPLYVISLRDPVERYVSFYRFVQKGDTHPAYERMGGEPIERAFDLEYEANQGSARNGQCRHISGDRKLVGVTGQSAIQALKDNYFLPMPMQKIDQSIAALRNALDLPKIEVQLLNKGTGPRVQVGAELRAKIEAANEMDTEVVTWVNENYKKLLEKACDYAHETCRSY